MIEYHHLLNCMANGLFSHSSLWEEMSMLIKSSHLSIFTTLIEALTANG